MWAGRTHRDLIIELRDSAGCKQLVKVSVVSPLSSSAHTHKQHSCVTMPSVRGDYNDIHSFPGKKNYTQLSHHTKIYRFTLWRFAFCSPQFDSVKRFKCTQNEQYKHTHIQTNTKTKAEQCPGRSQVCVLVQSESRWGKGCISSFTR